MLNVALLFQPPRGYGGPPYAGSPGGPQQPPGAYGPPGSYPQRYPPPPGPPGAPNSRPPFSPHQVCNYNLIYLHNTSCTDYTWIYGYTYASKIHVVFHRYGLLVEQSRRISSKQVQESAKYGRRIRFIECLPYP